MNLMRFPVDYLIDEKISLMQRIAKINAPVEHPPVGYRFPHGLLRHLQDRLAELNFELTVRANEQKRLENEASGRRDTLDIARAFK